MLLMQPSMLNSTTRQIAGVAALMLFVACGDDAGGSNVDGGNSGPDAMNNPPNPSGLGPAPVVLGTADDLAASGSYVVLAKTGITNVTGSMITGGHLGLSPAAASFITGFAMTADSTNVYATAAAVVSPGRIYAANYAAPTPTNLTSAVLGMQTAYTDAASRTHPDFLNLHSGNLGSQTLVPGLYQWGTGVTIPADVTISGAATDVWIFQISNNLDISTGKRVILGGAAQAKNIYWQVAGSVTIHANAHMEGVIMSKTGITLQTAASLHGRALAQTLVALDNNAVTAP
jgi:hypothetical protein